jgi:hypothetical protein
MRGSIGGMPYRREIVGGVIGALATVIFTAIAGGIAYSFGGFVNLAVDKILDTLEVEVIHGEYNDTKNGLADYSAKCLGIDDKLVGGMCLLRLGNGTLVTAGTTNREGKGHVAYVCDYQTNDANTLHAEVFAACLTRKH